MFLIYTRFFYFSSKIFKKMLIFLKKGGILWNAAFLQGKRAGSKVEKIAGKFFTFSFGKNTVSYKTVSFYIQRFLYEVFYPDLRLSDE